MTYNILVIVCRSLEYSTLFLVILNSHENKYMITLLVVGAIALIHKLLADKAVAITVESAFINGLLTPP